MSSYLVHGDTADEIALRALIKRAAEVEEQVKGHRICNLFHAAHTAADKAWRSSIEQQRRAGLVGRTHEVPLSDVAMETARRAADGAVSRFLDALQGSGEAESSAT